MPEPLHPPVDAGHQRSNATISAVLPRWLVKLSRPSRMLWLGPLLGFLLTIPSFFMGYTADDHIFRQQTVAKSVFIERPIWEYFNWVSSDSEVAFYREKGILVGWHTPDSFRFHLFRPLASMLHALHFRFLDQSPWVMHIGLALLYVLLIALCAKLLTRFSSSPAALGIGILLFAIDDTHAFSAGWISAYNTMLSAVFGLLALLMHDRWRRQKSIGGLLLFTVSFLLALLSSEGGLALMGYLLAYALFIEQGTFRKKAATLVPGAIIAVGYVCFYFIHHYGVRDCGGAYFSPFLEPWISLLALINNTLIFSVSQIISTPPLTLILQLLPIPIGALFAAAILAGLIYIFRQFLLSNKTVAFFGCGMILSIFPFTIGIMSDRLLLWAGIGAAGLLGELFTVPVAATGKLQRVSARTGLFSNIVFSAVFFIPALFAPILLENNSRLLEKTVSSGNTVFLNTGTDVYFMYAAAIRCEKGGAWPEHCYSLFTGEDTAIVARTGERTLRITAPKGWSMGALLQMQLLQKYLTKEGDVADLQLMTATIEKVTPNGRPRVVSFTFKKDLAEFSWMIWTKEGPKPCQVPPPGGEMRLFATLF